MIDIQELGMRFGDNAVLEDINLHIEDGDIYGLVGASGAGKSTILRCMNGLVEYTSGSVKVDGREVKDLQGKDLRNLQRDMAMIFQNFNLMSRKSVYENIAFPMRCWKYPKDEIDRTVRQLAETVGIESKLKERPSSLSGGQKQRVAIARALAMNPKILLSDESTSALDPKTTQSILELLKKINAERGITIVVVSHQMEVIRSICNNMSLLERGHITATGPVKELFFRNPRELNAFLGEGDIALPDGYNVKFMLSEGHGADGLLSDLARDLDVGFNLVYARTDTYQRETVTIVALNFPADARNSVREYLSRTEVTWTEDMRE